MTIFTIGYEGLSIDVFLALLEENNIETIVDVRMLPLSRKPGFSKKVLCDILNLSGFEYIHMPLLGCPKDVRNKYKADSDWRLYTLGFMQHLAKQEEALRELSDLALSANCALLCFEADHNFCHRAMVANALMESSGFNIKHLSSQRKTKAKEPFVVHHATLF